MTKCLIKAIESRLMHDPAKRQAYVDESMREGFILTAAFADLLPFYEKQPGAMRLYYPDLINAIDVNKERNRLKNIQFVQSVPQKLIEVPASVQQQGQAQRTLENAESMYDQHDYSSAKTLFQRRWSKPKTRACTPRLITDLHGSQSSSTTATRQHPFSRRL